MQKVKYERDADKEFIRYHALPRILRKFIVTSFGMKSIINVTLALFYEISNTNATLVVNFLRQNQVEYVFYFSIIKLKFLIYFHTNRIR